MAPALTIAHPEDPWAVGLGAGGKTLFTSVLDAIKIWDATTGKQIQSIKTDGICFRFALSPDGKLMAAGGQMDAVELLDPTTGALLKSLTGQETNIFGDVSAVAWSPDGSRLATAKGRQVKVWDPASGQAVTTFDASDQVSSVSCLSYSPDGKQLAGSGGETGLRVGGLVFIWDAATGKEIKTLPELPFGSKWVVFINDKTVACGLNGGASVDIDTGKIVTPFKAKDFSSASCGTLSSDRKLLATSSSAGKNDDVYIWDSATGRQLAHLTGCQDSIDGLCFSPDNTRVAASVKDKTARIWDVPKP